jgi:hypothetical protein
MPTPGPRAIDFGTPVPQGRCDRLDEVRGGQWPAKRTLDGGAVLRPSKVELRQQLLVAEGVGHTEPGR